MHKLLILVLLTTVLSSPAMARSDKDECWRSIDHGMSREEVFSQCGSPSYRQAGQATQMGPNIYQKETWVYDYRYEDESPIVIRFGYNGEVERIRER